MDRIVQSGRLFFAIGMAAFSVHQLIYADLRPVLLATWPSWIPGLQIWAYIGNVALILAYAAIIFGKKARTVAVLIGWLMLLSVLFNHLPFQISTNPHSIGGWGDAFKALAIGGGAFVIARSLPEDKAGLNSGFTKTIKLLEKILPFGAIFFAITIVVFGVEHFIYADFVVMLVPSWIPWHSFWGYLAGSALIASGIAIIIKVKMRLACILLGVMIFIWFVILHLPRAFADPYSGNGNEWRSVFEALAFSGIAFVLAGTPEKKD